jgi:hypothetical protein
LYLAVRIIVIWRSKIKAYSIWGLRSGSPNHNTGCNYETWKIFFHRITYESLDVFNYVKMIVIYRFNIVQMNGHWRLMWIPYFLCFTNFHGYHGWYQTMILRIQWIFVHTFICTDYRKVYTHLYVLTIERYPHIYITIKKNSTNHEN